VQIFLSKEHKTKLRLIFKSKQKIEDLDLIESIIKYINSRSWASKSSFKCKIVLFHKILQRIEEKLETAFRRPRAAVDIVDDTLDQIWIFYFLLRFENLPKH
jgi:hypothetical protein